jgi:hypothetical protein
VKVILERGALVFTIIASLLTILEYFGIAFSKDSFSWLPNIANSIIVWIYTHIILFEVNIWILILAVFTIYKLNIFIRNKKINSSIREEKKPKDLLDIFDEFEEDTKKVFRYVMYCEEKNKECTKLSISRHLRDTDISNLELDKILEYLVEKNFIKDYPNFMHPATYGFSKHGSAIAVALIKQSKESN